MLNQILIFVAVFFFSFGIHVARSHDCECECDCKSANETDNRLFGRWYAVMSSKCSDDGPCNIFTNNEAPCNCSSIYFEYLQNTDWEVTFSFLNFEAGKIVVDRGGASECQKNSDDVAGFILSRAEMDLCVISTAQCYVTEKIVGYGCFMTFTLHVIEFGSDGFMVTEMTCDKCKEPLVVVWSRRRTPGKKTTWSTILQSLYGHNLNPHDYQFISQGDNCVYPSMAQCDEIIFCQ